MDRYVISITNTSLCGATRIATNPMPHECAKHIKMDRDYIWELVQDKTIVLSRASSHDKSNRSLHQIYNACSPRVFSWQIDAC